MSLDSAEIERLKKAKQTDILLVFGYIRNNSTLDIPFGIIQICLLYYLYVECWDVKMKGNGFKISGKNHEVCECMNHEEEHRKCCQAILGILSVNTGKHHWKFKISKIDLSKPTYTRIAIGIIKMDGLNEQELSGGIGYDKLHLVFDRFYGFAVCTNRDSSSELMNPNLPGTFAGHTKDICCNEVGDIIDMYLDLDNQQLHFGLKGQMFNDVYGKDPSIIIEQTDYKMGMIMARSGTAIQLISYQPIDAIPKK